MQAAKHAATVGGANLELARGFDAGDVVPLEIDRARIVCLQPEAAALQVHDLACYVVAVGKPYDVGFWLTPGESAWRDAEREDNQGSCENWSRWWLSCDSH